VIASVRDITERKLVEDRIRTLSEQYTAELRVKNELLEARSREAEQANRLKSEFLASMSHELRTPLHTIIGFSELLTEQLEGPLNPKQLRFTGHILQDARHLLELINQVLDISKIESGRLELRRESFAFGHCLEEVLAGIGHHAATKKITIENKNDFQGELYADRLRVKEILYNLLNNAVKFTERGAITLSVREVGKSADRRHRLCFEVSDTGIGMSGMLASPVWPAAREGGPRNGVLTAIEEFVAAQPQFELHVVPVLLGGGSRLLDHLGDADVRLEQVRAVEAPGVTHLKYRVVT
jgi:signal transduction histidine kinase